MDNDQGQTSIPFPIVNLSSVNHIHIAKDTVVAFTQEMGDDVEIFNVQYEQVMDSKPRHWIPRERLNFEDHQ